MEILTQNYLTRGFWGDESWTALISQFPIAEIIRITGEDFHPPLYYFLVHGFISIFGASEWIRLISVFFWLMTPVVVFVLAKKLVSKKYAWTCAVLTFMSPILFTYAFEARAYALIAFISAASTLVFWSALKEKKWQYFLTYFLLGAIGVYAHYYMWFVFFSHGLFWLWFDRGQFRRVLVTYLGVVVAQLPWVPSLLSQVNSVVGSYWIGAMDKRTHWEFLVRVVGGDIDAPQKMFVAWVIIVLLVLSPIFLYIKRKRLPKGYIYLWMWLVVPVLVPTLISFYRPVFFYRYLIFSAIPILMIVVWGMQVVKGWLACGGGAFLLAFYISINMLSFGRFPHSMREEMEKVFRETPESQDFKLVTVLPSFAEVMYYNKNRKEVQVLPLGLVQFSGKSLLDAFERQGRVRVAEVGEDEVYWLIEPGPKSEWHGPATRR